MSCEGDCGLYLMMRVQLSTTNSTVVGRGGEGLHLAQTHQSPVCFVFLNLLAMD